VGEWGQVHDLLLFFYFFIFIFLFFVLFVCSFVYFVFFFSIKSVQVYRTYNSSLRLIGCTVLLPADLLKAYSMWLPESRHKRLAAMWPPV